MDQIKYIKSASIILERTSGEILLCKRNSNLSAFPDQWVFPGGKVSSNLDENWVGDEQEVVDSLLREMYEEIGVLPGTPFTIPLERRNRNWLSLCSLLSSGYEICSCTTTRNGNENSI